MADSIPPGGLRPSSSEARTLVDERADYKYGFSWPIDADKLPPGQEGYQPPADI